MNFSRQNQQGVPAGQVSTSLRQAGGAAEENKQPIMPPMTNTLPHISQPPNPQAQANYPQFSQMNPQAQPNYSQFSQISSPAQAQDVSKALSPVQPPPQQPAPQSNQPIGRLPGSLGSAPGAAAQPALGEIKNVACPNSSIGMTLMSRGVDKRMLAEFSCYSVQYNGREFVIHGSNPCLDQAVQFITVEIANCGQGVKWYWLDNYATFVEYDGATCRAIEDAYQRGAPEAQVNINQDGYAIEFGNPHRQVLLTARQLGKFNRTVRREGDDPNLPLQHGDTMWYWLEDGDIFKPYTPEAARQIEYGLVNQRDAMLVQGSNGKAYLVNYIGNEQMNEITGYRRRIRRGP